MKWPLVSWILSSSSSSSSSSYSTSSSFCTQYNNDSSYDQTTENENNEEEQQQQQSDDVSYKPENEMTGSASPYIESIPSRKDNNNTCTNIINSPPLKRRRLKSKRNVWTREDEMELLHGFLDYVNTVGHHRNDIVSFYDSINPENLKHRFNKRQLVDKLRRLRRKYYNIASRINSGNEFSFRNNSHEKGTFVLLHKIWGVNNNNKVKYNCEENMEDIMIGFGERSKRVSNEGSSLNKEEEVDKKGMMFGLANLNPIPILGLGRGRGRELVSSVKFGNKNGEILRDQKKWINYQVSELEDYSKRLELVQHQVKAALEDFKSMGRTTT